MYFTIIYNDYENYIFNCNYDNCINDIEKLDNNKDFNSINQFVKVYSSYEKIYNSYSMNKRINVKVTKRYSEEEIKQINDKIDSIIKELKIDKEENVYDKIKLFHDYIANTNKYDSDRENNSSKYHSDKAIGTLFEGYSVCNGYADTMSIFLDKIGVSNIKVATDDHVWNAIYLNDKWYHIDLTWDDPINNLKKDMIIYDYFMITTDELLNKNDNEHSFDKEIYSFIN
jgi:transglutaminase/protease-like cytokinesis protein 3